MQEHSDESCRVLQAILRVWPGLSGKTLGLLYAIWWGLNYRMSNLTCGQHSNQSQCVNYQCFDYYLCHPEVFGKTQKSRTSFCTTIYLENFLCFYTNLTTAHCTLVLT